MSSVQQSRAVQLTQSLVFGSGSHSGLSSSKAAKPQGTCMHEQIHKGNQAHTGLLAGCQLFSSHFTGLSLCAVTDIE